MRQSIDTAIQYLQDFEEAVEALSRQGNRAKVDQGYTVARVLYGQYVLREARNVARLHDLSGYVESEEAPSTYDEIVAEVYNCRRTRKPFRVWSGASEKTVFASPGMNWAFRFVHDMQHFQFHRGFTPEDEEWLGQHFTRQVASRMGLEVGILALCDGLGQVYYGKHSGHDFVDDQAEFVRGLYISVAGFMHRRHTRAWL